MPISRYWHSSPSELCHTADIGTEISVQNATILDKVKGVYREEGMQLALFSESSDFVLSYF